MPALSSALPPGHWPSSCFLGLSCVPELPPSPPVLPDSSSTFHITCLGFLFILLSPSIFLPSTHYRAWGSRTPPPGTDGFSLPHAFPSLSPQLLPVDRNLSVHLHRAHVPCQRKTTRRFAKGRRLVTSLYFLFGFFASSFFGSSEVFCSNQGESALEQCF